MSGQYGYHLKGTRLSISTVHAADLIPDSNAHQEEPLPDFPPPYPNLLWSNDV